MNGPGGNSTVAGLFKGGHFIGVGSLIALIAFAVPILMQLGRDEQQIRDLQSIVDNRAAAVSQVPVLAAKVENLLVDKRVLDTTDSELRHSLRDLSTELRSRIDKLADAARNCYDFDNTGNHHGHGGV